MKMKVAEKAKRLFAMVLTVCLLLSVCPAAALAESGESTLGRTEASDTESGSAAAIDLSGEQKEETEEDAAAASGAPDEAAPERAPAAAENAAEQDAAPEAEPSLAADAVVVPVQEPANAGTDTQAAGEEIKLPYNYSGIQFASDSGWFYDDTYVVLVGNANTGERGGTFTLSFEGTGISIYGQKANNGPIAEVCIDDGALEDVDFYNASNTDIDVKVYEKTGLAPGAHTLKLTLTERIQNPNHGKAKTQIAIGSFGVIPNPKKENFYQLTVEGGTVVDAAADSYYEAGKPVTVMANAPERLYEFAGWTADGVTLADASLPRVTFTMPANDVSLTAKWESYATFIPLFTEAVVDAPVNPAIELFAGDGSKGWGKWPTSTPPDQLYCNKPGDGLILTFTGTNIAIYGAAAKNGPLADIIIDEGSANEIRETCDFLGTGEKRDVYKKTGLAAGTHTLKLVFNDEREIASGYGSNQMAVYGFTVLTGEIPTYPVTVTGGSGSGSYAEGETVTIELDEEAVPENQVFARWSSEQNVQFGNASDAVTTIVVPAYGAAIKAEYTPTYALTVTGGSGSGRYKPGDEVILAAGEAPEGKAFEQWKTSTEVEFTGSETDRVTSIIMPAGDVTVTAAYRDARAAARDFYVDAKDGSDDADGKTPQTAWKTLAKVNAEELRPGDRVLLRAGSVFTGEGLQLNGAFGTAEKPIVVDMYEGGVIGAGAGARPHIKADGVPTEEFSRALIGASGTSEVAYGVHVRSSSHVIIRNLEISNQSASRKLAVGVCVDAFGCGVMQNVHLENLYVHDVNGTLTEKTLPNGGIYFLVSDHTYNTHFDNISVKNCTVKDVSRTGISVGTTTSFAQWDNQNGIIPQDILNAYGHTNVVIRNNYVENAGGDAIVPMFSIKPLIEYNISNGASLNTKDNYGAMYNAAIWPWRCEDAVFQFNEAYGTHANGDGQAYDCDWSRGTVYQYNYSHDNEGGFILVCQSEALESVVRYNISQNDLDSLFLISNSHDAEIYNNTFYVGEGLNTQVVDDANGRLILRNNIFYNAGTRTNPSWGNTSRVQWDNNLFHGYETTPNDAHKIEADPMFLDPGKGGTGVEGNSAIDTLEGYRLAAASPAVDAGVVIENNGGRDYLGNRLADGNPDLGAIESTVPQSALDELQENCDRLADYNASDYDAEAWAEFAEALCAAQQVLEAENPMQKDIDAAQQRLLDAEAALQRLYAVTVEGGTASADKALAGDTVTVTAQTPEGKRFVRWESDEVTLADGTAEQTTFVMPASAVRVTAVYETIPAPDDSSSSSGSSGSSGSGDSSSVPPVSSTPFTPAASSGAQASTGVQTGDSMPLFLLSLLLLCSMGGLAALVVVKHHKGKEE